MSRQATSARELSLHAPPDGICLPAWILHGAPMPPDGAALNRLCCKALFAQRVPNWTSQASDARILRAIHDQRLVTAAERFGDEPSNLLLVGPTGIGKTTSLAHAVRLFGYGACGVRYHAIVQRCLSTGSNPERAHHEAKCRLGRTESVYWVTAHELTEGVRSHPLGQGEAEVVQRAKSCRILVLDDLGNERGGAETLFEVADSRYRNGRRTISSSGLTLDELTSRYGQAFVRRLIECRGEPAIVVDCFAKSGRKVRAV